MKRTVLALLATALLGSCGYFNSFYNARRQFSDAERARTSGNIESARTAYTGSIEKAAKSYRKYPNGRWADDALYLIARAHFQLADYPAARAAFQELLARSRDGGIRTGAHAFAGAVDFRLASMESAGAHLDSAIATIDNAESLTGFARLWRARARAASGNVAGAWEDLDAVTATDDSEYAAAQLERVALALTQTDTARLASAVGGLLAGRDARRQLDTLKTLALRAAPLFGASKVRELLTPPGAWTPAARDSLALIRAQIAANAGDTLNAHRELLDLATHAEATTAAVARVIVAKSRLAAADRMEQLTEIRALLLPAISLGEAQRLIQTIRLVDVMVRRSAQTGQPLALFGAAEVVRDDLAAPLLARKLFIAFAEVGGQTPWAAKAVLAAIALAPADEQSNELRARLVALPPNPYTALTRAEAVDDAYDTAEERLARSLIALKEEASRLAQEQEAAVTRAIAILDSITAAARADTVRAACGVMIDTLAIVGIRADSVRTACMRRDSVNLALYLKLDTMTWKPATARDSLRARGRRTVTTTPRPAQRDSIK